MPAVTDVGAPTAGGGESSGVRQLDDRFVAAWNARSVDEMLALMTDDVVYDDAGWPRQMHGHAEVRAFLESTWRAVPDLSFERDGVVLIEPSGTNTASYWRGSGTQTGVWDPPGLKPTGRRFSFHGGTFLESRDGKLCRVRVVYDVVSIMRQVGVLPEAGSPAERVVMIAANFVNWLRGH
jgi:steroid delta-isomerase-like uncharacterized protein